MTTKNINKWNKEIKKKGSIAILVEIIPTAGLQKALSGQQILIKAAQNKNNKFIFSFNWIPYVRRETSDRWSLSQMRELAYSIDHGLWQTLTLKWLKCPFNVTKVQVYGFMFVYNCKQLSGRDPLASVTSGKQRSFKSYGTNVSVWWKRQIFQIKLEEFSFFLQLKAQSEVWTSLWELPESLNNLLYLPSETPQWWNIDFRWQSRPISPANIFFFFLSSPLISIKAVCGQKDLGAAGSSCSRVQPEIMSAEERKAGRLVFYFLLHSCLNT